MTSQKQQRRVLGHPHDSLGSVQTALQPSKCIKLNAAVKQTYHATELDPFVNQVDDFTSLYQVRVQTLYSSDRSRFSCKPISGQ